MRFAKLALLLLGITVLFASFVPASAAPNATILSVTPNTSDCTLTVVFQVEDAGTYRVLIYDDSINVASGGIDAAEGETVTAVFGIGNVGGGAAGIGIYITDGGGVGGTIFDDDDPYEFEAGGCGEGGDWSLISISAAGAVGGCSHPLPSGYTVRSVPAGAHAYYEPSLDAYAGFTLPAGTWYVGASEGDFAPVWIACEGDQIYIPVASIG